MVTQYPLVYVFAGGPNPEKDRRLSVLRSRFLAPESVQFNSDTLYAREITLKDLQEKLLCLPVNNPYRLITVKSGRYLKEDVKSFIRSYAARPYGHVVLVIDMDESGRKDTFVQELVPYAEIVWFPRERAPDAFLLARQIHERRTAEALRTLNILLAGGEKAEKIMGGLRWAWEKDVFAPGELRRRLKLLLVCDKEVKTGLVKPVFALEKLVITLSGQGFGKTLH